MKANIRKLKAQSEKAGLFFNLKKTKIMTTEKWTSFEVDGEEMEVVTSFCFLGAMIENDGGCDREIRRRIACIGKDGSEGTGENMEG